MIINKSIGPCFAYELVAAGLGEGVAFDSTTVWAADNYSSVDKLVTVVNAHDSTKKLVINAAQVTDTQFIQALAESKYAIISWDEAYNWGGQGQLPQILITALDKITDTDTRNRAYMKARSAKSYIYSDRWVQSILPLLPEEVVAKMPGIDAQDKLQQLFNFAATL